MAIPTADRLAITFDPVYPVDWGIIGAIWLKTGLNWGQKGLNMDHVWCRINPNASIVNVDNDGLHCKI